MTDKNGNWTPPTSKDPNVWMTMQLIPRHRQYLVREHLRTITISEKAAIRGILNMRKNQPFPKCRGRAMTKVRKFEAEGDFSHSKKTHVCELCQCGLVAGQRTKGDFYGLGINTGHFGVGWCENCQVTHKIRPHIALKIARRHVELIQRYNVMGVDESYELKLAQEESALAVQTQKDREDMKLVTDELKRFMGLFSGDERPTEYVMGKLVPMSDASILAAKLSIAQSMSKLDLNHLKMDADKYIAVEELKKRIPEMMNQGYRCFASLEEMLVATLVRGEQLETDLNPQEHTKQLFQSGMKEIWSNVKTGRGK